MDKQMPRYKAVPDADELPRSQQRPNLVICQVNEDGKLALPKDVRAQFMQDPIWSVEWREIVKKFDAQWGEPIADPSPSPNGGGTSGSPKPLLAVKVEDMLGASFDWQAVFMDEPKTRAALEAKHSDLQEMVGGPSFSLMLAPGPKLYAVAKDAMDHPAVNQPVITHGAGAWLLGEKADKYEKDHGGRGVPCAWTDDSALVVLEELGYRFISFPFDVHCFLVHVRGM